ncbi:beta family protein [Micromonospora sp. CNB394]|uniref:beta family protein n=1 Tax=Micromonospora sp. CNB394 TaxID=1169151 RepID=UPI000373EADE|nr:beta family protein [Micromonospora sp. CNB394]
MAGYYPILKGRKAEFRALDHIADELVPHILPIFDVPPSDQGSIKAASAFSQRAQESIPRDMAIAVDVRHLPEPTTGTRRPLQDIADDLHRWGIPALPVAHLHDTPAQLADVRDAAAPYGGVIRLPADHTEPDAAETGARLSHVLSATELHPEDCILILDVAEVPSDRDLTSAEPLIRKHLAWARRHPWKTVVVAAGAMPANISHVPAHTATPLRRRDFDLWKRLQEHDIQFADYGITCPRMSSGTRGPAPNLRYTHHDAWWAYRATRDGNGNIGIYDICKALVSADHWPAAGRHFSWGDEQIALRAACHAGTGVATDWIAWGTSHHLAYVAAQLGLPPTA